jgi:hypothetical protein
VLLAFWFTSVSETVTIIFSMRLSLSYIALLLCSADMFINSLPIEKNSGETLKRHDKVYSFRKWGSNDTVSINKTSLSLGVVTEPPSSTWTPDSKDTCGTRGTTLFTKLSIMRNDMINAKIGTAMLKIKI